MTDILKNTAIDNSKIDKTKDKGSEFIWKGPKEKNENGVITQEVIDLMEQDVEKLRDCMLHCNSMLYNTSKTKPGRYVLLNMINEQISKCNAELFRRELSDKEVDLTFLILNRIKNYINDCKVSANQIKLGDTGIFEENTLDYDYCDLTLDHVCDALQGKLGLFDKSHLTLNFCMKQGIWFTNEEFNEMINSELFKQVGSNKVEYVRRKLMLPTVTKIVFLSTGFSLQEMEIILSIKSRLYSKMETDQLIILRDSLLFSLAEEAKEHIESWEGRINTIRKVAKAKKFKL